MPLLSYSLQGSDVSRYKVVYFRLKRRWRKSPGNCSGLVVYTVESVKNSRFCAVECLGVIPLDSRVVCSVVKRNERVHLIIRVKVCQFMSFLLQKSIPVHFSQPLYNAPLK